MLLKQVSNQAAYDLGFHVVPYMLQNFHLTYETPNCLSCF
jgi:hypothetical protein